MGNFLGGICGFLNGFYHPLHPMQRGCNMKSGVGFLAFRLCRWASVLLIILLSLLVVSCDLWNKDMLGYLKYWSETVQLGKVEVNDATIQKNDAGADTIPVAATPTIAVYVVNPQGYGLLAEIGDSSSVDKSVRVSDSAVQSKAQVVAHEPTLLKVQLGSADGSLEHTEFRVDFEAIRKDTMQSSGQVMGVTLRYNTPPVAPTPVVWNYDSSQHEVVKDGETWEADRNGILYWAYDDSITKETDPNCAKWFSINGTRHPVAECKVPDVQVDGLSVFQFKTNYGGTSVVAVDSEGVSSPAVASGQAVPPATYIIKYDGNGADGGTAPTSQSKTQYTDITLATNSGGLTRIGYRFTGWNTAPDGTGMTYSAGAAYSADESVTLYAQWEAVDAVVLTPESGAVNHGATVTLTPPKSDATIYYQIGGADETAGAPGQSVTVTLYNANHLPQDATGVAAGIPEGGSVTLTAHAVYADGTKSEVTTGDYRLNQYTVRYEGNGNGDAVGNVPAPQTFYSGGSVAIGGGANRPVRIGYRFTGWNTDPDGAGRTYFAGATYSADESETLYAQWEAVDAVVLTPEFGAVNHGATVTLTPPTMDATIYYQIDGADEVEGTPGQMVTVTLYNASHSPSSATGVVAKIPEGGEVRITAYAKYADDTQSEETTGTYSLNQYTVSYEGNGNGDVVGNVPDPQTFYSGGSVAIEGGANRPERIGYRFTGWNTASNGNGTPYPASATYSANENETLYAQWEAVDAVTFSRDGAVNSGDTVQLTPPKAEVTIYYSTDGGQNWNQGQPNQSVTISLYNENSMPQPQAGVDVGIPEDGEVTIAAYAVYADGAKSEVTTGAYTLNQYTVSYEGGGDTSGAVPSEQFYSGGSVAVQSGDSLTKEGYTFKEWLGNDGQFYSQGDVYGEDENLTLTAQWDPNTYYVSFNSNGGSGSMDPQQFTYDQPKQLTAMQFTRTDYEFTGWNTQANGRGTSYTDGQSISKLTDIAGGTVTLYAQWKIAVITLAASEINSADDLRAVLANYSNCKITVNLGGKQLEVTNSDLATNKEFFTVKDGNKVTITNGTVAVTGDFSSVTDDFLLFSVKTGSTLDLSGCTLSGKDFGSAGVTAVKVSDGGSLTLTNTTISDFDSNSSGAGVHVGGGGSAIMNSGAIMNNNARYGAAVYLFGSFTMNGGEISGNTNVNGSSISGDGTFEWNGGTISNNTNGSAEGGSAIGSKINYGGTKNKNDAS